MKKFWGNENPLWYWVTAVMLAYLVFYISYNVVAYSIPNGYYVATVVGIVVIVAFSWLTHLYVALARGLSKKKNDGRYPDPHFINDPKLYTLAEFVAQYKEDLDAYHSDLDSEGVKGQKLTYYDWCRRYANFMSWADR
jgi:hypothetical protein